MNENFITPNALLRSQNVPSQSFGKDQSYLQYLQMLKSQGLQVNQKLYPSMFKLKNGLEYSGLATRQTLNPNEVFIKVPKHLMLSAFKAIQRPELQDVFKQNFFHISQIWNFRVLNTYMLYIYSIKQTQNIWYHLVKHLSKNIDVVAFWPEQQINKFNDQCIKISSKVVRNKFQQQWKQFQQIQKKYQILQNPTFTKQNYKWIYIHVLSRPFGKKLQFLSFAPLCEYFNHHSVDGSYKVQKSIQQNQIIGEQASQNGDNKWQTTSISSDGSCESEDYVEDGQFDYSSLETNLVNENNNSQKIAQDPKKIEKIIQSKNKIVNFLSQYVKLNDFSIIFISSIIKKCNSIHKQYCQSKLTYQRTLQILEQIYSSVKLYHQKLISYYKKYHKHSYEKYIVEINPQESKSGNKQIKYSNLYSIYSQNSQKVVQFPKQQTLEYDHFILYNGYKHTFEANNQVFFRYGKDSNHTLLYWYGFTIEGNKYENVRLSFDIKDFLKGCDTQFNAKYKQKHQSLKRKFRLKRNQLNVDMIMFFRQILWLKQNNNCIQNLFGAKNYQNEINVLTLIKQQIDKKLLNFNQQYDLTDPKLSYHEYFINIYLKQKAVILKQHSAFTQKLICFLQLLQKGVELQKAKEHLVAGEKYIFRNYLSEF